MTPSVPSPQSTDTATLPLWEDVGIVDLNAQGEGVGRHDGQVVFVPYTIPGEIIDVQVIAKRPNFARGALERLRMTAPTRATPQCPHFAVCGGCQYQHIAYPAQPEIAAQSVRGNLVKLMKGWDLPEPELIASSHGYGYRTQTRLQFRTGKEESRIPGYVGDDGLHVTITECAVLMPVLQRLLVWLLDWIVTPEADIQLRALDMRFLTLQCNGEGSEAGVLFHTYELMNLRKTFDRDLWGDLWVSLQAAIPEVVGLVIDNGQTDEGFGRNFTLEHGDHAPIVPFGAFKQNNPYVEEEIFKLVQRWIHPTPGSRGLDGYCGRGELTARLAASASAVHVTGVESAPIWFDHHRHINQDNLSSTLLERVLFVQNTTEQFLQHTHESFDWAVLNPPRKGMEEPVMAWLRDQHQGPWVYVSCNPATFARDCQDLKETFRLTHLAFLDMFPQTAKMELVARFERR